MEQKLVMESRLGGDTKYPITQDSKPLEGFTNLKGVYYPNVREVAFTSEKGFNGCLGKMIGETKCDSQQLFLRSGDPVYVYQSKLDPKKAYRIYHEFASPGYDNCVDAEMIQKLQERQPYVIGTKFPTGVVTMDGRVIGQEVPFFEDYVTLLEFSKKKHSGLDVISIYIDVLKILKEMYQQDILYMDNHAGNFMINADHHIEVIDFDSAYVKFQDYNHIHLENGLLNYRNMIMVLNTFFGIDDITGKFLKTNNFEDTFYQLDEMSQKVKQKRG